MPTSTVLRRTVRTACAGVIVAAAALLVGELVVPAQAGTATTLQEAAAAAGREFGVAMGSTKLGDSGYTAIAAREFGSVTPEIDLTYELVERQRNQYVFSGADALVAWALTRGKTVRGWGPLYGVEREPWLYGETAAQVREDALHHLAVVVGRYRGKVRAWDVVVEAVTDAATLRDGILARTGGDWIAAAFATAHQADPAAQLCYTDYGIEDWTAAKTQRVYALLKQLLSQGVPVGCVGIEAHFTGGVTYPATFRQTLTAFGALGLDVQLTQLEVTGNAAQATVYAQVVNDCLAVARCTSITVCGVRDSESWRQGETPTLFDEAGRPKPAYTAVLAALNAYPPSSGTTTTSTTTTSTTTTSTTTTSTTTTSTTTTSTTTSTSGTTSTTKTRKPKPPRTVCRTRKKDGSPTCKTRT